MNDDKSKPETNAPEDESPTDLSGGVSASPQHDEPLWTARDLEGLLQIPRSQIYDMVRNERIPAVRIGQRVRFIRREIRDWLASGAQSAV